MKIGFPKEYSEIEGELPSFQIPEFVPLMDQFIKRAEQLKPKIESALGSYNQLGIVGIGGSQVQPYVFSPFASVYVTHLEVPDPYVVKKFLLSDPESTRVLYLSRSGATKEILSFIPYLSHYPSMVVTNGDPLLKVANEFGWFFITVSHDVSGRFAIQNELGVVPMIAMGLDPKKFLSSLKKSYKNNFKQNSLADQTATCLYNFEKSNFSKIRILPSGFFPQGLGILLTQLINESAPKRNEDTIDASLHSMPRSAHSDVQRWFGGAADSAIFSISSAKYEEDHPPSDYPKFLKKLIPGLKADMGQHLNITSHAIEDTFPGPVIKLILEKDSLEECANTVGFLHAVIIRLCQIKGSNPFDEPAVIEYKNRATKLYKGF
jgi:glucose-6-phosphate isomerase